jgi:hypothetical protein
VDNAADCRPQTVGTKSELLSSAGAVDVFSCEKAHMTTGNVHAGSVGPGWLHGEQEAPAGTKDMGGWTANVYTSEQQARLGVDQFGQAAAAEEEEEEEAPPAPFPVFNGGLLQNLMSAMKAVLPGLTEARPECVDCQERQAAGENVMCPEHCSIPMPPPMLPHLLGQDSATFTPKHLLGQDSATFTPHRRGPPAALAECVREKMHLFSDECQPVLQHLASSVPAPMPDHHPEHPMDPQPRIPEAREERPHHAHGTTKVAKVVGGGLLVLGAALFIAKRRRRASARRYAEMHDEQSAALERAASDFVGTKTAVPMGVVVSVGSISAGPMVEA